MKWAIGSRVWEKEKESVVKNIARFWPKMNPATHDQPEGSIDELYLINALKQDPPPIPFSHDLLKRMRIDVHEHWKDNPMVNGQLIVVVDKNGRLTALGYPHGSCMLLLERRKTRRIAVHSLSNSIIGDAFNIVSMANEINGDWAWEPDKGMSISALMQMFGTA